MAQSWRYDPSPSDAPGECTPYVLFLNPKDFPIDIQAFVGRARKISSLRDGDKGRVYWVVFEDDPIKICGLHEEELRDELLRRNTMVEPAQLVSS